MRERAYPEGDWTAWGKSGWTRERGRRQGAEQADHGEAMEIQRASGTVDHMQVLQAPPQASLQEARRNWQAWEQDTVLTAS